MRRVYTEYVLPESRCPGGGGNNQKLVRFSLGIFLKLWKCIATLDGHSGCYAWEAPEFHWIQLS